MTSGKGAAGTLALMSIFAKASKFLQSRQGRDLVNKAKRHAESPEGRRQIDQIRQKVMKKGGSKGPVH